MRFTNEAILAQTNRQLGGLGRGIEKLKAGYPKIGKKVDEILTQESFFPIPYESPTGDVDIIGKYVKKDHLLSDSPYSNEEWQQLLGSSYPFPESYRGDKRVQQALQTSLKIQQEILESNGFKSLKERINALPSVSPDTIDSPMGRYIENEMGEPIDFGNINIHIIGSGAKNRLEQISYSQEEANFKDEIINQIGNPMAEVFAEIKNIIERGGNFD